MFKAAYLIPIVSFFISAMCSFMIYKVAHRFALIDVPNERSSHVIPTPRGGGIGICLAFIIIGIFVIKNYSFTIIAGTMGLFGFLDDCFDISSKTRLTRLIFPFIIATAVILSFRGMPDSIISLFLFMFWIVFVTGTANFFNFMDGINGIAGLTDVVGFGLIAFFSFFIANEPDVALMSIALVAGCLGFLPFNFPRAKVFMGDGGSLLLGFVFASFAVKLSANISIFFCLVMFLCTFYADAIVTILYRWRRGENLLKAHRGHLYQYLSNELRLPHWKVSLVYALVQFVFGVLALLAYRKELVWQFAVFGAFGIMSLVIYKGIKDISRIS